MPDVHQLFVRLFYGVEVTLKHDDGSTVGRQTYISTHGQSTLHPFLFNPGKETRYPLYRRQGGSRGRSARVWSRLELFHPPELEFQPSNL